MHDETDDPETDYSPLASLTINSAPHWLIEQLDEYARSREPGQRRLIERLGRNATQHAADYDDDTLSHQLALVQLAEMSLQSTSTAAPWKRE